MRWLIRIAERALGGRYCRVCGCTGHAACEGGCWWAGPGLCSRCAQAHPEYLDDEDGTCFVRRDLADTPDAAKVWLRTQGLVDELDFDLDPTVDRVSMIPDESRFEGWYSIVSPRTPGAIRYWRVEA